MYTFETSFVKFTNRFSNTARKFIIISVSTPIHVITSLETRKTLLGKEKRVLGSSLFHRESDDEYSIFNKKKYERLRKGHITPISVSKTKGFGVWSGYEETRDLHISVLKGNEHKHLSIKK